MKQADHITVYLGSVLLEANRWANVRQPTYRVSEWADRIADAGFDGIELWENHILLSDAAERNALSAARLPVAVFNSYASLDRAGESARLLVTRLVRELGARAVKFNVSASLQTLQAELRAAAAWAATMPTADLLCECHPGTALEDSRAAAAALAGYPQIGVIIHPFSCADLSAWLRHLASRIRHAHVQVTDAHSCRCRLRDQAAMVRERMAMLHDAGFSGSFTIEFTVGVGVAPEDRDDLFAAACDDLAFLRDSARAAR